MRPASVAHGNDRYKVQQQGRKGDIALGFSVVNATNVFPGIRFTGRLAGDRRGQMTLGETTIINGTGVQTSTNSRWGDYTDMTVDPTDDCTFWYVNEYYTGRRPGLGHQWLADAHREFHTLALLIPTGAGASP